MKQNLKIQRYFLLGYYSKNPEITTLIKKIWRNMDDGTVHNPIKKFTTINNIIEPKNRQDTLRALVFYQLAEKICSRHIEFLSLTKKIETEIEGTYKNEIAGIPEQ